MSRPRVYLAGPDLFFPDAEVRYARLKAACESAGLVGVAPNDGLVPGLLTGSDEAHRIYEHDMRTLQSCDAVLANLSAFRGTEPDSGTVFEAAWAFAKGMPVAGYTVDGLTTADRHLLLRKCDHDAQGVLRDRGDGGAVEPFGQGTNLMLACSFPTVQTPQQGVRWLTELLPERVQQKQANDGVTLEFTGVVILILVFFVMLVFGVGFAATQIWPDSSWGPHGPMTTFLAGMTVFAVFAVVVLGALVAVLIPLSVFRALSNLARLVKAGKRQSQRGCKQP